MGDAVEVGVRLQNEAAATRREAGFALVRCRVVRIGDHTEGRREVGADVVIAIEGGELEEAAGGDRHVLEVEGAGPQRAAVRRSFPFIHGAKDRSEPPCRVRLGLDHGRDLALRLLLSLRLRVELFLEAAELLLQEPNLGLGVVVHGERRGAEGDEQRRSGDARQDDVQA